MNAPRIVFSKDDTLFLDTSMTQSAFANSRLSERLAEHGVTAENKNNEWTFAPWTFTGTMVSADSSVETVLLEGTGFDGCTLKEYFDEAGKDTSAEAQAAVAVCSAINCAIKSGQKLPNNGAGGIFISTAKDRIIFVPEDLFETAAACRGETAYSENEGMYLYRTLGGNASLRFTQAVIAYRALSGTFPYTNENTVKRHEDYGDKNFAHLADTLYGVDNSLATAIDSALMQNDKNDKHTDKNILPEFPLSIFCQEVEKDASSRTAKISPQQFYSIAKKKQRSFARSLAAKRWFRHYNTTVLVGSIVVALIALFAFNHWKEGQRNPTTKSLTSTQTVDLFYSAVNNLDVVAAQCAVTGTQVQPLLNTISNFYVTSKSRSGYDIKSACVTPASWLWFNSDGCYTIFGLTQLTIDGVPSPLMFEGPRKSSHPRPLSEETGIELSEGASVTHLVHYFQINSEGLNTLHIIETNDTVSAVWHKDKWQISSIIQKQTEHAVEMSAFYREYKSAYAEHENDPVKAAAALSSLYTWINTPKEVIEAKVTD